MKPKNQKYNGIATPHSLCTMFKNSQKCLYFERHIGTHIGDFNPFSMLVLIQLLIESIS